jgi:hypothetical protein
MVRPLESLGISGMDLQRTFPLVVCCLGWYLLVDTSDVELNPIYGVTLFLFYDIYKERNIIVLSNRYTGPADSRRTSSFKLSRVVFEDSRCLLYYVLEYRQVSVLVLVLVLASMMDR